MLEKEVLTTGDVARICSVTIRTVIKWFESGDLVGYKIPGSKDRRIPRENLLEFMRRHGIPVKGMGSGGARRLLIADDDTALTEVLAEEFGDLGLFEIRVAHSGYEAGMVTVDFRPDLILLDYNLGDVTGEEVTRLIRENPAVRHVKIILMSGMIAADKVEDVLAAGADDFVAKPFEFESLRDRVFRMLQLV